MRNSSLASDRFHVSTFKYILFWFALHVTYDESFSEDPRGAGGSEGPATLAVNRGIFLWAPRLVEGH